MLCLTFQKVRSLYLVAEPHASVTLGVLDPILHDLHDKDENCNSLRNVIIKDLDRAKRDGPVNPRPCPDLSFPSQ